MGVLISLVSLVLGQLNHNRRIYLEQIREQEIINLALMAVQTQQERLTLDGLRVELVREEGSLVVYEGDREVLRLDED